MFESAYPARAFQTSAFQMLPPNMQHAVAAASVISSICSICLHSAYGQNYLPIGGSVALQVYTNSCNNGFENADVAMLFSAVDLAPGIASVSYDPNPTDYDWESDYVVSYAQVSSTTNANTGVASWYNAATPVGGCPPGYSGGSIGLYDAAVIIPAIAGPTDENGNNSIWWMNQTPDNEPSGYPDTGTLTLSGVTSADGPFTWTITAGTGELEFTTSGSQTCPQNSTTCTTTLPQIAIQSLGPSPAASKFTADISITATTPPVPGSPYPFTIKWAPFKMAVRQPYKNIALSDLNYCTTAAIAENQPSAIGFSCYIYYQTADQFRSTPPGDDMPLNENWQMQSVQSGSNWSEAPCDGTVCNKEPWMEWRDQLESADFAGLGGGSCANPSYASSLKPEPISPPTPAPCTTPILTNYDDSGWWVGGDLPGQGVQVQSNNWILYLNHGIHTNINSPP